jgi:hypothetical protein
MTQQFVTIVSQLHIVQADTVSIVGVDTALNRAPTKKSWVKTPRPIDHRKRHGQGLLRQREAVS